MTKVKVDSGCAAILAELARTMYEVLWRRVAIVDFLRRLDVPDEEIDDAMRNFLYWLGEKVTMKELEFRNGNLCRRGTDKCVDFIELFRHWREFRSNVSRSRRLSVDALEMCGLYG